MRTLHRCPPAPGVMAELYAEYLRIARDQGLTFAQYLAAIGFTNPAIDHCGMDDAAHFRANGHGLELISIPSQPVRGTLRVKVLLVDFPDLPGSLPTSHYEELLFSKNTHPTGSMRDYYGEVSLGKVDVTGSVHGWLRLPHPYSFYTNGESGLEWNSYPRNAPRMAEDAVNVARQSGVVFEPDLDRLGRGTITALFIVHAGLGAERFQPSIGKNHIWSHKWSLREPVQVAPGLFAANYLTVPNDAKLGVCAHELGHLAFQWEDFYDPNYDEDGKEWDGSGRWDLMAGGSYNGGENRPAHPVGLHKSQHGWIDVEEVRSSQVLALDPFTAAAGKVAKVFSPAYRSGQYLLLENRRRSGFDSDLPGEGLLVWRVDETREMTEPGLPALLLVQADGRHQLETPGDWNEGDAGDPFPGTGNRTVLEDSGDISTSFPGSPASGITLENIQRDPATGRVTVGIRFAGDAPPPPEPGDDLVRETSTPHLAIPDATPAGIRDAIAVKAEGAVREIAVSVDVRHTYVGDLRIELAAPNGQRAILQDREGGNRRDLDRTYSSASHPALAALVGGAVDGDWELRVADLAGADTGTLEKWGLAIALDRETGDVHEEVLPDLAIPDKDPAGVASTVAVTRGGTIRSVRLGIEIEHTYIGDLRVELVGPSGEQAIVHNREGGKKANLERSYQTSDTPALATFVGRPARGDWALRVSDNAGKDTGTLKRWTLDIEVAPDVAVVEGKSTQAKEIPDKNPAGVGTAITIGKPGVAQTIEVSCAIKHSYIGDLRVELEAPSGARAVLHDRAGGRTHDLRLLLNSAGSAQLAPLVGQPVKGNWILRVADLEALDTGTLEEWSLRITYA